MTFCGIKMKGGNNVQLNELLFTHLQFGIRIHAPLSYLDIQVFFEENEEILTQKLHELCTRKSGTCYVSMPKKGKLCFVLEGNCLDIRLEVIQENFVKSTFLQLARKLYTEAVEEETQELLIRRSIKEYDVL